MTVKVVLQRFSITLFVTERMFYNAFCYLTHFLIFSLSNLLMYDEILYVCYLLFNSSPADLKEDLTG
jgi:hypothetical protein